MTGHLTVILTLALCCLVQADLEIGQVENCQNFNRSNYPQNELFNYRNLRVDAQAEGLRKFAGSLELLEEIANPLRIQTTIYEMENGDIVNTLVLTMENACDADMDELMNGPASNIFERIFENRTSPGCEPPVPAGVYDMTNVTVNQSQLKNLDERLTYALEIIASTLSAASCIRLTGKPVPNSDMGMSMMDMMGM